MSSAQAVAAVKKLSAAQKCGHMGTLDPFACGVLLIALGKATKLFDYFIRQPKNIALFLNLALKPILWIWTAILPIEMTKNYVRANKCDIA